MSDETGVSQSHESSGSGQSEKHSEPRYAGFWIRLLADIIDSFFLTIVSWVLEGVLLYGFYKVGQWINGPDLSAPSFTDAFSPLFIQIFNIGVYGCLAFPYYVWGHFRFGTTLGKRPFGVYVVDQGSLGAISVGQSISRTLGYLPAYALFLSGFLMAALHPKKQGLHELLSGTVSVRK